MERIDILKLRSNELRGTEQDNGLLTYGHGLFQSVMHQIIHIEHGNNYRLMLPANTNTSSIYATQHNQYSIFVEVYPNYALAYEEVNRRIDKMLDGRQPQECSPDVLTEILVAMFGLEVINNELSHLLVNRGKRVLDNALFRYIITGQIIHEELRRYDSEGTAFNEALQTIRQSYCDSLTQHPGIKATICEEIGKPQNIVKPSVELVDEIVRWRTFPQDHPTLANLINYSKSPDLRLGLMETRKEASIPSSSIIWFPDTNQLISTKMFDNNKQEPINTPEAFDQFIYKTGDFKHGNKVPFMLKQTILLAPPSVYWSNLSEKGTFNFKVMELGNSDKKETVEIDQEEMDRRAFAYMKEQNREQTACVQI